MIDNSNIALQHGLNEASVKAQILGLLVCHKIQRRLQERCHSI